VCRSSSGGKGTRAGASRRRTKTESLAASPGDARPFLFPAARQNTGSAIADAVHERVSHWHVETLATRMLTQRRARRGSHGHRESLQGRPVFATRRASAVARTGTEIQRHEAPGLFQPHSCPWISVPVAPRAPRRAYTESRGLARDAEHHRRRSSAPPRDPRPVFLTADPRRPRDHDLSFLTADPRRPRDRGLSFVTADPGRPRDPRPVFRDRGPAPAARSRLAFRDRGSAPSARSAACPARRAPRPPREHADGSASAYGNTGAGTYPAPPQFFESDVVKPAPDSSTYQLPDDPW